VAASCVCEVPAVNDGVLCVGIVSMDETLNMLGMTSVFVGGFMALILDNMIPGTAAMKCVSELGTHSHQYVLVACGSCCEHSSVCFQMTSTIPSHLKDN